MNINKKYFGFTLAEVLITLVIIGVIAAITVPALIHKHRAEEFESRFKKAESVINSVVNYYKFDTGELLTVENANVRNLKNSIKKHFQVIEDCGSTGCYDNAKPPYKNFSNTTAMYKGYFNDGMFVLNDGMTIFFDNDNYDLQLSVDINGYKKKPNRYGYDVFTFTIASYDSYYNEETRKGKGKVLPGGHPYTRFQGYCSKTSNNASNGISCAYQASKNPNYFKELMW